VIITTSIMLGSLQSSGKSLKWGFVSCCKNMYFPLESCKKPENLKVIKVRTIRNISYVKNIPKNFKTTQVLIL
jgi:hypothetical protein